MFSRAFVDYRITANDPAPYLPYVPVMKLDIEPFPQWSDMSNKHFWASYLPNHQHLMGGSSSSRKSNGSVGATYFSGGTNLSSLWIDDMRGLTTKSRLPKMIGEIAVHELTHQYRVNGGGKDHCAERAFESESMWCTMFGGTTGTPVDLKSPQWSDGAVEFHFTIGSPLNSEYFDIRNLREPMPQWNY